MIIIYEDEYSEGVYWGASSHPASVGDTVVVDGEEWFVKSRVFYPQEDKIVITLSQMILRTSKQQDNSHDARVQKLQAALSEQDKRLDQQEKKTRQLNEKYSTIKSHINSISKKD